MIGGGRPLLRKIWRILTHPLQNADFQSIFLRNDSTVTASEQIATNTTRKSTTSFPMSTVSYYYSLMGSCILSFDWYLHRWPWITLNGVIARVLLYFTEFDSFAGQLRHSGWRHYTVCRISSSTFRQNWPTLQRGISAIAELLVKI